MKPEARSPCPGSRRRQPSSKHGTAGSNGANALGNILFGAVNPSGKLPNTFPLSEADLPHPTVTQPPPASAHFDGAATPEQWAKGLPPFPVAYDEGVKVGYKWYDAEKKPVLFPFGFGLSYTTFGYSDLKVSREGKVKVSFTLANTGSRAGAEIAEVYAALPASAQEPPKRLVGWSKVTLQPGEKKQITVEIDPKYLSIFDEQKNGWVSASRRIYHHGRRLVAEPSAERNHRSEVAGFRAACCCTKNGCPRSRFWDLG